MTMEATPQWGAFKRQAVEQVAKRELAYSGAKQLRDYRKREADKEYADFELKERKHFEKSLNLKPLRIANNGHFKVHAGNRFVNSGSIKDEHGPNPRLEDKRMWPDLVPKRFHHYLYRGVDIFCGKRTIPNWSSTPVWAGLVQPMSSLPIHRLVCDTSANSDLKTEADFLLYCMRKIDYAYDHINDPTEWNCKRRVERRREAIKKVKALRA